MSNFGRPAGWRLAVTATLLSAFVSLGFSVASVVSPSLIVHGAERIHVVTFAAYALSRSIVIAAASVVASTRRTAHALIVVGWIAGGTQALDAFVGLIGGDLGKILGPAALAAISAYAMIRLGRPRASPIGSSERAFDR